MGWDHVLYNLAEVQGDYKENWIDNMDLAKKCWISTRAIFTFI